eukprot:SAG31_NODE_9763_length_1221_cov_2.581786_1_plen_129_part_10
MQDPDEQLFRRQAMSLTVRPLRSQQPFVDSSITEGDVVDGSALEGAVVDGRPVLEDTEVDGNAVGGPVLEDAVVVEGFPVQGHGKISGKDACMEPPNFDRKLDDRSATELLAAFSVFSPINFAADISPF